MIAFVLVATVLFGAVCCAAVAAVVSHDARVQDDLQAADRAAARINADKVWWL